MKKFALLIVVGLLSSFSAENYSATQTSAGDSCNEELSGRISNPRTLANTGRSCDYLLKGALTIKAKVVIEPGVRIRADANSSIRVEEDGQLLAGGTAQLPIIMQGTSANPGHWRGITVRSSVLNVLQFVQVADAGKFCDHLDCTSTAAINFHNGEAGIIDSVVSNSAYYGVSISGPTALAFKRNKFFNNGGPGVRIISSLAHALDTETDYAGVGQPNGIPMPEIIGIGGSASPWKKLPTPYFISGIYELETGIWDVEPGVEIVLDKRAQIRVEYNAVANFIGTEGNPIKIRGYNQEAGYWDSIRFKNNDNNNILQHVEITDFGNTENISASDAAIYLNNASLSLHNVRIRGGLGKGIECVRKRNSLTIVSNIEITDITDVMIGEECP